MRANLMTDLIIIKFNSIMNKKIFIYRFEPKSQGKVFVEIMHYHTQHQRQNTYTTN